MSKDTKKYKILYPDKFNLKQKYEMGMLIDQYGHGSDLVREVQRRGFTFEYTTSATGNKLYHTGDTLRIQEIYLLIKRLLQPEHIQLIVDGEIKVNLTDLREIDKRQVSWEKFGARRIFLPQTLMAEIDAAFNRIEAFMFIDTLRVGACKNYEQFKEYMQKQGELIGDTPKQKIPDRYFRIFSH